MSKILQDSSISACDGKKAAESVVEDLKQKRSGVFFHKLWVEATTLSDSVGADAPCLPRAKTVPKRLDDGASPHRFSSVEEYYCVRYFEIVDQAIGAIERRFQGKGYAVLLTAERVIVQAFAGQEASHDDLHLLREHFRDDIDFRRLPAQLQVLVNINKSRPVTQLQHAVETVCVIGVGERGLIPDVVALLKLCLVLPASTASAERSFSTLRRIKSYLRSTMTQERLNHLMILSTYKDRIDKVDMTKLLNDFIQRNDMRQRTFSPRSN